MSFRVWSSRLDSLTKLPRCQGRNLSTHVDWFSGWVASAARETVKSWCLVHGHGGYKGRGGNGKFSHVAGTTGVGRGKVAVR